jgi:hypothetical protein
MRDPARCELLLDLDLDLDLMVRRPVALADDVGLWLQIEHIAYVRPA